ncbi:WYL domain-containing protein [Empedobacter brevis]|nr:WYL domain-containing protein [Empedobacter brevis]MDM1134076.1 WYL domain-containing protein [Empedobacter sp. R750]
MRKTIPIIRIIRLVQYINECNVKEILPLKNDIISHIQNQFPDEIYNVQLFNRDKKKIREELGIDLKCDKENKYYIDNSDQVGLLESSLDYYEMFSILTQANALPGIFLISDRKPLGLNQINDVVSHINNKHVIQFSYSKYDTNETEVRIIEPLAIKESKERWYIIGMIISRIKVYELLVLTEFLLLLILESISLRNIQLMKLRLNMTLYLRCLSPKIKKQRRLYWSLINEMEIISIVFLFIILKLLKL